MKKDQSGRNIAIISIVIIMLIIAIAIIDYNKKASEVSAYKTADIYNNGNTVGEMIETDVNLFTKIRDNKDKVSIIYIGRPTCTACINYYPIIEEVSEEYGLDVYYANLDNWTNSDLNGTLTEVLIKFEGTPTTLIMYKGQKVSAKVGDMEKATLVDYLTEHKLIR